MNLQDPRTVVILLALSAAGLVWLLIGLKRLYSFLALKQGYPNEEQIERYLLPLIRRVIVAVYELSEHALERFGRALESADKREMARLLYDLLPDEVAVGPARWRWKKAVSLDEFAVFVQREFDRLIAWYREAEGRLLEELRPVILLASVPQGDG